ncbi:hypothetical protein ACFC58_38105 [Kitasatospora purpeofusca]|uniref:hypothetical protein n=1 Tax=Kitasatospora purpeofusca TaxID=67352 RepID=UPI0035DCB342
MTVAPPRPTAAAAGEAGPRVAGTAGSAGSARWSSAEAAVLALPRARRADRGPSALQILNRQRQESSHEHYLKFLLDPAEVHGLGTGLLNALLDLAGLPALGADPRLATARVHRQVRGTTSRPDLIVTSTVGSVVIELKVDAPEGAEQTTRQGDDFTDLSNPVFVYLTPDGRPADDARFHPVALRDLAGRLAVLLTEPAPGPAPVGRRHAEDYLTDLEATVGISADDDDDARFWVTHGTTLLAAQEATRRLLTQLPAHAANTLAHLAADLGADLTVTTVDYGAQGSLGEYPETAVVISRPQWLANDAPVLGFGLGIRRATGQHLGPDPDTDRRRPFHGIYCTDPAVRAALRQRFLSKGWGGRWAWYRYIDLTPQPHGTGFLEHNATGIATAVRGTWTERAATVDTLWNVHRAV